MAKMLQFNQEALKSIHRGVKTLAKAVIVTLGPKGRNVVIGKDAGSPSSTKDGVTVAKEIVLKDKFENIGAQLVKQAASKAADVAGDGTTTAIVLAEAMFTEGMKNLQAGAHAMSLKRGIDAAAAALEQELNRMAKAIQTPEEIRQIAQVSANNDAAIGEIIANAMDKVGKDGVITIGEAKGIDTVLDVVEGLQFDKGYASPYFITNPEEMSAELENALIFITDKKLSSLKEIVPILEEASSRGKPILLIAEDYDAEALATLVVNKIKGGMALCAVKAPGFGDRRKAMLEDIAILTGATILSSELGYDLDSFSGDMLGSAKKIKIAKDATTIVDGGGSAKELKKRIAQIRHELETCKSDYDKEKLEERLARLAGGVAVVNVGAATESEANEKKSRIEDALHATRAAVAQGVVPGGGVALIRAAKALDKLALKGDEAIGADIVRKAASAPAIAIARNCGKNGEWVAEKISEKTGSFGYNGLKDEFSDLVKDGVLDPVLVTKSALLHAASIAGMMLTITAMITDKPEPKKKGAGKQPPGMPPMGGMGGMPGMGDMMM